MRKATWMGMAALLIAGMAATPTVKASMIVEEYTYGSGATEWTNTTAAVGEWSLMCTYPMDGIHYAGVRVTGLGDPLVKDFADWSYWTRGPEYHGVNFWMFLDTPYENYTDRTYDIMLGIMPYNILWDDECGALKVPGDTWVELDESGLYPYQVWSPLGGYDIATMEDAITWSEFQALDMNIWGNDYDFGEAVVKMVIMRTGGGGVIEDVTAYIDDFTLNGETHPMIPEPASLTLLGLAALAGVRRRRR